MATSIAALKATPYSVIYSMTSDDGTEATVPWAALNADLVPGPLKSLLAKLNAGSKLDHLNLNAAGPGIESKGLARIRHLDAFNAGPFIGPANKKIVWTANGLTVKVTTGENDLFEIRLAHSRER
jgi:hypothetical protein